MTVLTTAAMLTSRFEGTTANHKTTIEAPSLRGEAETKYPYKAQVCPGFAVVILWSRHHPS
jgi:hypothetical protein